jgi:hypothetical protein
MDRRVMLGAAERAQLIAELRTPYEQGASIRELTVWTGRSYGFVRDSLPGLAKL